MINILVVDDHALIRNGLKMLLEERGNLKVTGEAGTGSLAIQLVRDHQFDIVLLDLSLPDQHGIEVLKQLRIEQPLIKVIVLSMHPEDQYGVRVIKSGAMGYINKQSAPEKLVGAIEQVFNGKKFISPTLAEQLIDNMVADKPAQLHQTLSNREYQTLCQMASGHSLTEIAEIMMLSAKTVSVYRARMLEKMGFKNNAEAIHYAISHHLVGLDN